MSISSSALLIVQQTSTFVAIDLLQVHLLSSIYAAVLAAIQQESRALYALLLVQEQIAAS